MKFTKLIAAMALTAGMAHAGVNINWYVTYGVYPNGGNITDATPGSGLLAVNGSGTTILQLIWCGANGIIDPVDPNNSANGYVGGDDQVWEPRTATMGGNADEWVVAGTTPNPYTNPTYTAGLVYARVFFDATPAPGEYYYNTGTLVVQNVSTEPAFTQPLYIGDSAGNFGVALDTVIVPEPSAVMLAGLGALVLAIRRRRQA